ncbi:hypothetical protein HYFRA_00007504 [Hymenoscyphus fraxineus]|uniref:Uncharacterized protein n=1 Tax=Hymenoscyphus fraxineus TaxID=746836 RepID=A0A9N9KRB1_9HELO|nr:hypothetical protein HYFRA_00007504 [Hymenoscyphus fraxineus]
MIDENSAIGPATILPETTNIVQKQEPAGRENEARTLYGGQSSGFGRRPHLTWPVPKHCHCIDGNWEEEVLLTRFLAVENPLWELSTSSVNTEYHTQLKRWAKLLAPQGKANRQAGRPRHLMAMSLFQPRESMMDDGSRTFEDLQGLGNREAAKAVGSGGALKS